MSSRYVVRPRASQDIDDQAYYYATTGGADLGHRFLVAVHETFALLATHSAIGWPPRLKRPPLESLRVYRVSGFERILILYRPLPNGVEIVRVIHGSRDLQPLLRFESLEPNPGS